MPFRGFVAVPVPAESPLVALLDELRALRADLKPVEPTHLHFTLSFLGQVADDAVEAIGEALREAAQGVSPFALALKNVGAFPSARRPRVVWVGVEDPRPIVALALRVREALAVRGLRGDDKDFRAHLTLARVKHESHSEDLVRFLVTHGTDDLGSVAVQDVRLFKSTLSPAGPAYETLDVATLEA